jgi:hypothetical protein
MPPGLYRMSKRVGFIDRTRESRRDLTLTGEFEVLP